MVEAMCSRGVASFTANTTNVLPGLLHVEAAGDDGQPMLSPIRERVKYISHYNLGRCHSS